MAITLRRFEEDRDVETIGNFLSSCYEPLNRDGNWFRAIWDWSCCHAIRNGTSFGDIGIWVEDGEVVAATVFDEHRSDVSLSTRPEYRYIKEEMLEFAEENLSDEDVHGDRFLNVFVSELDTELQEIVTQSGYERRPKSDRTMAQYDVPSLFPEIRLPDGFALKSLAEENDILKIHRVLHRGFNHPGEPPGDGIEGRKVTQSNPNFRHDLTIVVKAPGGDYVTYCGMWYDEANRFGYVEPVVTDPDYRRRGLGKATVLESIRRCAEEGAEVVYVWSDRPFYTSLGFKRLYTHCCWTRRF